MEALKELVQVVNRNKVKRIEVMGDPGSSATQLRRLYEGISAGEFQREADVEAFFYSGSPHRKAYARRLQKKLKARLLNTLFFIDVNQEGFSDIQQAYYTCHKNLAAVKVLTGRYARLAAAELAEKTIQEAVRFEFTGLILELARELRLYYGFKPGESQKFSYYNNLIQQHTETYAAELQAEEYYTQLIRNFTHSKGSKTELTQLANELAGELEKKLQQYHSYRFSLNAYLVLSTRCEILNDYAANLEVCRKALAHFQAKRHIASPTVLFSFLIKMLVSLIQLGRYPEAEEVAARCRRLQPEGSVNWFNTLDYSMILFFRSGQFDKAYETFRKAVRHPSFNNQYRNVSEQWRIYEAFIYLLILLGKIRPAENDQVKKFRISRFVNEVPTFSKDKRGANITILILQVLFLLQQRKYGQIIDRMESLKTYSHRYLRRDETYRSNCFIKMLLTLPQAGFHRKAVLRRAEKYVVRLQEVPLTEARQNVELEVMPYELLWSFALQLLDNDWH